MKLNYDCIRDILEIVEETTSYSSYFDLSKNFSAFNDKYTNEEILYHIRQCYLSGYLYEYEPYMDNSCIIQDLSPAGHEFLNTIRSENVWQKTKDISKEIGVKSLHGFAQIATQVVSQIISNHLKL